MRKKSKLWLLKADRLNDICRACLEVLGPDDRHNIFQVLDLVTKFKACTTLTPEMEDSLPVDICTNCYNKLYEFQEFQNMCLASDNELRELLAKKTVLSFDDEKPVFDLDKQTNVAITISETEVLLATENSKKDMSNSCSQRHRGRPTKSHSQNQTIVEAQISKAPTESLIQENTDKDCVTESDNLTVSVKDVSSSQSRNLEEIQNPLKGTIPPTIYKCDRCPTRFFAEHRLVAHKRGHDGLVPYPCTQTGCDRGFNRLHCLSEHLKQHKGTNRWYACEQVGCTKVYKHKPTLVMHLRKYHKVGPELKSHVCEICGKVFKSSAILNDHRYTHRDKSELPHACTEPQCLRRFSNKEKLKVHMMRHAGIKNFVCPHCGMRKTTRNELKIHINYHTLERTWPCRYCSKVCNSAGNLKMHVRTVHERAKDYACRFCERTFGKPDTRKYHEMTHTGEKPHVCDECGKRFTQPAALRTHRKIHLRQHNEKKCVEKDAVTNENSPVTFDVTHT